ncbi:MAG TPA: universal stress protein [Acidimicrobiales bacterium]|jgi:nucleotide-binding universal stress UspA family protein|nr:universal stress protein [Acidimicrobiales bacterium]
MNALRIVVAVDGSDSSLEAVKWAAGLARSLQCEVVAVHALGLLEQIGSQAEPVPVEGHRQEIDNAFAERWCQPLMAAGVVYSRRLEYGRPADVILRHAQEADLIVLGHRRDRPRTGMIIGSTSAQVVQDSTCPVVVVPR